MSREIRKQILAAYDHYATHRGAWVPLGHIRSKVNAPREVVDEVLIDLATTGEVMFTPEMNQRPLDTPIRHCALWMGNEFKHLMSRL